MAARVRSGEVRVEVSPSRLVVIPGGRGSLEVLVSNRGETIADFDLTLAGVPTHWGGAPTPLMGLKPGEQRGVRLTARIPAFPEAHPSHHELIVRAVRRSDPPSAVEVVIPLIIASFELEGRVGALMESTRFVSEPGEPTSIPVIVSNHGTLSDTFEAAIEGLPASWITSPAPRATVGPGERSELSLTVVAPRGPSAQAGERPFSMRVSSRESPDQAVVVECTLEVPEVHEFGIQVLPNRTPAGQAAAIKVQNRGNAPTQYTVTWESLDGATSFTPPGPSELTVGPGQTERVAYLPRLRRRPLFGGSARYSYTVTVSSSEETHVAKADVLTTGLLPGWLGTVALFSGILALLFYVLVQWAVSQPPILTPTPDLTLTPPATPTVPPGLTPVG
jgi:uncharacterized membrane protein